MSHFETSQLIDNHKGRTKHTSNKESRGNSLVVVVTKAQGLRNVLKLDKQSPFVSIRIQNQEESTRTVLRGGQTPIFNDELWFSLDGTEKKVLFINVYHQGKKDAKLVCCGEVDFTTALRRSVNEGYDGWFDLYWEGRTAGKVYLEITYYPSKGEIPIGTMNPGRYQMAKTMILPKSADGTFRNSRKSDYHDSFDEEDEQIPELGELSLNKSRGRDSFTKSHSRTPSNSPVKRAGGLFSNNSSPAKEGSGHGWFSSMINNTFGHNKSDNINNVHDDLTSGLKLKSPDLVQERPSNLFKSDSDNDDTDDEEYNNISPTEKLKRSIASKQDALSNQNKRMISSMTYQSENSDSESEEEYTIGQVVNFRSSSPSKQNSPSRKLNFNNFVEDDEFTKSYQSKKLPVVKSKYNISTDESETESDDDSASNDDLPPPPPKHTVSVGNLFDSINTKSLVSEPIDLFDKLPKTGKSAAEILSEKESDKNMSWYDKRKSERRKQR